MFRPQPQDKNTRKEICPECRGSGKVFSNSVWKWGWKICQSCNGTGQIEFATPEPRPYQRNPLQGRRSL